MAMTPSQTALQEQTMTPLKKLSAAALTVTVLATSSLATSSDAFAKSKHRAPKFGGNPMMAMMMGGGGGGNPMAMLAKNPAMLMMAITMISKMAGGGSPMGGSPFGGFGPPAAMFGAPPMGSPFGQ
jgi:hypothetical protein